MTGFGVADRSLSLLSRRLSFDPDLERDLEPRPFSADRLLLSGLLFRRSSSLSALRFKARSFDFGRSRSRSLSLFSFASLRLLDFPSAPAGLLDLDVRVFLRLALRSDPLDELEEDEELDDDELEELERDPDD